MSDSKFTLTPVGSSYLRLGCGASSNICDFREEDLRKLLAWSMGVYLSLTPEHNRHIRALGAAIAYIFKAQDGRRLMLILGHLVPLQDLIDSLAELDAAPATQVCVNEIWVDVNGTPRVVVEVSGDRVKTVTVREGATLTHGHTWDRAQAIAFNEVFHKRIHSPITDKC